MKFVSLKKDSIIFISQISDIINSYEKHRDHSDETAAFTDIFLEYLQTNKKTDQSKLQF